MGPFGQQSNGSSVYGACTGRHRYKRPYIWVLSAIAVPQQETIRLVSMNQRVDELEVGEVLPDHFAGILACCGKRHIRDVLSLAPDVDWSQDGVMPIPRAVQG